MCEVRVIQKGVDSENEIMKEVEIIKVNGGEIRIIDILGREKTVNGSIVSIDLLKNVVEIV